MKMLRHTLRAHKHIFVEEINLELELLGCWAHVLRKPIKVLSRRTRLDQVTPPPVGYILLLHPRAQLDVIQTLAFASLTDLLKILAVFPLV